MQSGTYVIFLGTGKKDGLQYCLGVLDSSDVKQCAVAKFDPKSSATTWVVSTVPGAEHMEGFYLQHLDSQLFAHFGNDKGIFLDKFNPNSDEYFLRLDSAGDGQVVINNHSDDLVMDANLVKGESDPVAGSLVTPWKWNEGNNQKWRFVSTDLLAPGD